MVVLDTMTPCLGIGDLLNLKMRCVSNNITIKTIKLVENIIFQNKLDPHKYLEFIIIFIQIIFPEIHINRSKEDFQMRNITNLHGYPINKTYIYDDIIFEKFPVPYTNYLLLHTKVRIGGGDLAVNFVHDALPNHLIPFLKTFKTDKIIILTGERIVEQNSEVIAMDTVSIYSSLLLLKENNHVIDLTQSNLCSGVNIRSFFNDVELINKADCNIVFGLGGPYYLCNAFSKNNIFYISEFHDIDVDNFHNVNKNSHRSITTFINKINSQYMSTNNDLSNFKFRRDRHIYLLGHLGLGDNITYCGAIRFLNYFYNRISIFCKLCNVNNLRRLFSDIDNIQIIGLSGDNDIYVEFSKIDSESDILVSGYSWREIFNSRMRHPILETYKQNNKNYNSPWNHIYDFYNDLKFDLSVYYEHFSIPISTQSIQNVEKVQKYRIIFLHFSSGTGNATYPDWEWKHIYNDEYIIVDPDKNHYDPNKNLEKYNIANELLNLDVCEYINIIINASYLYITDSCFACMILPLKKMGKIKGGVIIYDRLYPHSFIHTPTPIVLEEYI